jgi:hypothetical protein
MYAGDETYGEEVTSPTFRPNTLRPLALEDEQPEKPLTTFQQGQLLYVHFEGDFKYQTDKGTRVPNRIWQRMLCALIDGGYIELRGGPKLTPKGRAYVDANHLTIEPLS